MVVDSSALIAILLGEPGRTALAEVIDVAGVQVEPADAALAQAAFVAWQRFGKGRHRAGLNFGDCFAYALADRRDEPLLFKGDDFIHTDLRRA